MFRFTDDRGVLSMAVRLLGSRQPSNIIPLRRKATSSVAPAEPVTPEPARLYQLIVLTFLLHVPSTWPEVCACCDRLWPCEPVRLAFRLREGF